jgi:hypothetical protein
MILWGALSACVTLSILRDFYWPTLVLLTLVTSAQGYWLLKHRNELRAKYETAEAAAAIPGPYDKQIWRHKPMVRDLAPGLAIFGLIGFYSAYTAAHGDPPTKIAKLIHQFLGVPGVVAFWSLLAVILLSKAIETIVGSRVKE